VPPAASRIETGEPTAAHRGALVVRKGLIDADFGTQIRVCHSRGGCGLRAAGLQPAAAEGTAARLEKAVAVLNKLTDSSGDGIRPEEIASAHCVAVIPGFSVVGVVFEADLLLEVGFWAGIHRLPQW